MRSDLCEKGVIEIRNSIIKVVCLLVVLGGIAMIAEPVEAATASNNTGIIKYVDGVNGKDADDGSADAPFKTVRKAYQALKDTGGRIVIANTVAIGDQTVTYGSDYYKNSGGRIDLADGCYVDIRRKSGFTGRLIQVNSGKLILDDIYVRGYNVEGSRALIYVAADGRLDINGAELRGNDAAYFGGAVFSEGIVNMTGGTITACTIKRSDDNALGGGIYNKGTFIFSGGFISECSAVYSGDSAEEIAGGGAVYNNGIMEMNGGIVSSCKAKSIKTDACGGGVYNKNEFTLNSGTVKECRAEGLYAEYYDDRRGFGGGVYNTSTFKLKGNVKGNYANGAGGGIYNHRVLQVTAPGSIELNHADVYGGGLYNDENLGQQHLSYLEDCTVSNNTCSRTGGGIYNGGLIELREGCSITDNESVKFGGGVHNRFGTLNINGGSIKENDVTSGDGGGVYNASESVVNMSDGIIAGNTSKGVGDGVFQNSTFNMRGSALIASDNEVFLYSVNEKRYINVTGPLTEEKVARVTPSISHEEGVKRFEYKYALICVRMDYGSKVASDIIDKFELTPEEPYFMMAGNLADDSASIPDTDVVLGYPYKVTLDSQGAEKNGTPEAWYKYMLAEKVITESGSEQTNYFFSNEEFTEALDEGYRIVLPEKAGYIFKGYFSEKEGQGKKYVTEEGIFTNQLWKTVGPHTLYAHWVPAKYMLTITKEIDTKDFWEAHGDSTFIFAARNVDDTEKVYFRSISFSGDDMKNQNGIISKSTAYLLPAGTYRVEEVSVMRYGPSEGYDDWKEVQLPVQNGEPAVKFRNEKSNWSGLSHNDLIINSLAKQ